MDENLTQLFAELDRRPTVAAYTAAAGRLDELGAALVPVRVALLSSFTVQPLVPYLEVEAARMGFRTELYVAPFNQVPQELLDPESGCGRHRPDVVFVSHLLEDLAPSLAEAYLALGPEQRAAAVEQALADVAGPIERFRAGSQAVVVVHNFAQRCFPLLGIHEAAAEATQTEAIRGLNERLRQRLAGRAGVHVLDFDRVCADVGYRRWRNDTAWHLGRAPLAPDTLRQLARVAAAFLQATSGAPRKCLVLDLDDTLWGGVVGEVGAEDLRLGPDYPGNVFRDFQKTVLELHRQGVLLAINSKNNRRDAEAALAHPDMVLAPEHFAARRINWRDKPQNMVELADELGIGLDAMVFVDDNPAERELMRRMLPQVETLELPADPGGYAAALVDSRAFDKLTFTAEDRRRGEMYRAQRQRRELERSAASLEEYFRGLEMKARIEPLDELVFQRAVSLLGKTNQFNLTTRRHSPAALEAFAASSDAAVFTLRLADRFGDNGVVGLAIVELRPGEEAVVDSFLLSCRVIGRTVETALLAHVADWARRHGARRLVGVTRRTARNEAFLPFYQQHGFRRLEEPGDETRWALELDAVPFSSPPYIHLTGAASEVAA